MQIIQELIKFKMHNFYRNKNKLSKKKKKTANNIENKFSTIP